MELLRFVSAWIFAHLSAWGLILTIQWSDREDFSDGVHFLLLVAWLVVTTALAMVIGYFLWQ